MRTTTRSAALALAALALCASAQARDVKLLLPVAPVLAQPETQKALGGTLVRFGAPPAASRPVPAVGTLVNARSWARFTASRNQLPDGRIVRLTDEETCMLALRYTLGDLVATARDRGGQSVVDVVSNHENTEMNSATEYQCVAGSNSAIVTLRGRAAGPDGTP